MCPCTLSVNDLVVPLQLGEDWTCKRKGLCSRPGYQQEKLVQSQRERELDYRKASTLYRNRER